MEFSGRIWLITDENGKLMDDIDTDMIYHNAHLAETDVSKMGQYAFGNLKGFKDFSEKVKEGDVILVGENFGSGSSRQQAVDCFESLGVSCIIAGSYGAIYKRNAINSAFPIFQYKEIAFDDIEHLSNVKVLPLDGKVLSNGAKIMSLEKPPKVQLDILGAGGLFEYAKTL